MSRAPSTKNDPGLSGLPGFNRQPLTPEQQMQALKRVQAQAEQRVKLGMQLFKAAEARLSSQTDIVQQIKTLQKQLREQVNNDVAKSLHQYDQWIGQIDESFTTAIRKLEEKVDAVQANITRSETRMRDMLDRAETMLDQSRCLLEQQSLKLPAIPRTNNHVAPPPTRPQPHQATPPPATPAIKPSHPLTTPTDAPPIVNPEHPPVANPATTNAHTHHQAPQTATPAPYADNPDRPPQADPHNPDNSPPPNPDHQEKIYSQLLQRLIQDSTATEQSQPGPDNIHRTPPRDAGNADAA